MDNVTLETLSHPYILGKCDRYYIIFIKTKHPIIAADENVLNAIALALALYKIYYFSKV